MNAHPLLKSWAIVIGFWYVAGLIASEIPLASWPGYILLSIVATLLAVLVGAALLFFRQITGIEAVKGTLISGTRNNGLLVSVGSLVTAATPKRAPLLAGTLKSFSWWDGYQKRYPEHAAVMKAVEAIYEYADLPASPVEGGHGGASLLEHSVNVLLEARSGARNYCYTGLVNSEGTIVVPVRHPDNGPVVVREPMLTLVAFAHDIGKVACYKKTPDGIKEVKPNHDIEGAKLLRTVPEVAKLSLADRRALLIAVGYYHHIGAMPTSEWISDEARALTEYVLIADDKASAKENARTTARTEPCEKETHPTNTEPTHEAIQPVSVKPTETAVEVPVEPQYCEETSAIDANAINRAMADAQDEDQKPTNDREVPTVTDPDRRDLNDGDDAFNEFVATMLEPNRINGKNVLNRIGLKYGDRIYIEEPKLRDIVADRLGNPVLAKAGTSEIHPWSLALMNELDKMGALIREFGGVTYPVEKALFRTSSKVEGHPTKTNNYIMIIASACLPAMARLTDCKVEPYVDGNMWDTSKKRTDNPQVRLPEPEKTEVIEGRTKIQRSPDEEDIRRTLWKMATFRHSNPIGYKEIVQDGIRWAYFALDDVKGYWPEFDETHPPENLTVKRGGTSKTLFVGVSITGDMNE